MLLRNSISTTKKFFQKTIGNFKSFLSKGGAYERLPKTAKTPPFRQLNDGRDGADVDIEAGYKELDNFYVEFTHQWDSNKSKVKSKPEKKAKKSQELYTNHQQKGSCNHAARSKAEEKLTLVATNQGKYGDFEKASCVPKETDAGRKEVMKCKRSNVSIGLKLSDLCSRSVRERRLSSVAMKLKELELMDKGNVEHKLDVEAVLHYYSRLTCPAYLDIVDKFFTEICTEFFSPQATPKVNYSTSTYV